ncbi:hypothetical protein [Adhaeribacter aquaticus]|uniref:hypothetical protein n=1 Tax=Adhaeribacter aquaticus TaxID=299567 RepID=UPI00042489DB|nr:hypothetical protein [Adhaeribacter aquaticus]
MIKIIPFIIGSGLYLSLVSTAIAQGKGNDKKDERDKWEKEYKEDKDKREKEYKDRYKDDERYKNTGPYTNREKRDRDDDKDYDRDRDYDRNGRRRNGGLGGVLGRVIFPPVGSPGPRQLAGVPKGHYPPPGECRVWYPNRPPGQQPPPTSCHNLRGVRLEPGAFVLHGDRAYDADYDWREEERRRPGSVGRDILDILFPPRR